MLRDQTEEILKGGSADQATVAWSLTNTFGKRTVNRVP